MTNRKNQNSILFLTTLGVYLGLVLVGATPQVLAQAATAKQFSVKDEIKRRDELDNKPDNCRTPDLEKIRELNALYPWYNDISIIQYSYLVERFLDAYANVDAFSVGWKSVGDLKPDRTVVRTTNLIISESAIGDFEYHILDLGNGLPGKSFSFAATKDASGHLLSFESRDFSYDTPLVRYLYGSALDLYRCSDWLGGDETILRHTEIKVEGTSLIITTRLPRGSLDSLLASDAK